MKLKHYNDGKGKYQSHEVYSDTLMNNFEMFLCGYGETKVDAYEEFIIKLDEYIKKVNEFRNTISIDATVEVDCLGVEV